MKIATMVNQLEKAGFNKRQIADQLHITASSIGKWVEGIHPPSKANLKALEQLHSLVVDEGLSFGLKRSDELNLSDLGELVERLGYQATFTRIVNI